MSKAKTINEINIGDVFYSAFINNHGKKIFKHPFIVINKNKNELQILDARAILSAVSVTLNSKKGKQLKSALEGALHDKATILIADGAKKPSIAQLDTYYLFSDDLLPINITKMFSKEKTKEIVSTVLDLVVDNKMTINKTNLKPVIVIKDDESKAKELNR